MMIGSTVELLAVNNENRLLRGVNTTTTAATTAMSSVSTKDRRAQNKPTNLIGTGGTAGIGGSGGTVKKSSLVAQQPHPLKALNSTTTLDTSLLSTSSSDTSISTESTGSTSVSHIPHTNLTDLRRAYACLNHIGEQISRPFAIDYFFADEYMFENNCLTSLQPPVPAQPSVASNSLATNKPGTTTVNTISPKVNT